MHHFIFNLAEGDRERAKAFLHAKLRPLKAINVIHQRMAAMLQSNQ
jgi:hypothetical protein